MDAGQTTKIGAVGRNGWLVVLIDASCQVKSLRLTENHWVDSVGVDQGCLGLKTPRSMCYLLHLSHFSLSHSPPPANPFFLRDTHP